MRHTKKLLASVAALSLLCAGPAFAGQFSLVTGTQTGGAQRDISFNGSTQVITLQPTSNIAVGNVAFVVMSNIVGGGASGCWNVTDTKGNTWLSTIGCESQTASATEILWSILTAGLTTSDTVTATQASGPLGTTGMLGAFSSTGAISLESIASDGGSGDVANLTVGPTGSGTCNGTTNCRVAICAMSLRDASANTRDASYNNIGVSGVGDVAIGYKFISSSTAAQSCTNTFSPATRATGQLAVFTSAAAAGATIKAPIMRNEP